MENMVFGDIHYQIYSCAVYEELTGCMFYKSTRNREPDNLLLDTTSYIVVARKMHDSAGIVTTQAVGASQDF